MTRRRCGPTTANRDGIQGTCNDDEFDCGFGAWTSCVPRTFLNTESCARLRNIESISMPCRTDEFACANTGICIPRYAVRDGVNDCVLTPEKNDTSDEDAMPYHCSRLEFRCRQSGRCIPREWVMDDHEDCPSGDDEEASLSHCYPEEEFQCSKSGRCLRRYRVMDGFDDCRTSIYVEDQSDEESTNLFSCNLATEFRCTESGRCIPRIWMLDGTRNCQYGSDEKVREISECQDGEFRCLHTPRCILNKYLCDGIANCKDCSDEIEACEEPRMWICPGVSNLQNRTCIPQSYGCDMIHDCPGGSDSPNFLPGFECRVIVGGEIATCKIPQRTLTDSHAICAFGEDLCYVNDTFQCEFCAESKTIIGKHQVCDGVVDCRDLWDECLCDKNWKNKTEVGFLCDNICYGDDNPVCRMCSLGELYCGADDKCVNRTLLCDGKIDCPQSQLDERFCDETWSWNAEQTDFKCWPLLSDLAVLFFSPEGPPIESARRCDGVIECPAFEDECSAECPNPPSACERTEIQKNKGQNFTFRACNVENTSRMIFAGNVCDGVQSCDDSADELQCPGRHYCETGEVDFFEYKVISIEESRRCDGRRDCIDSSDEINCTRPTSFDPFSSEFEMIENKFLRFFLWMMAVLAIGGNIFVSCETYYFQIRSQLAAHASALGRCNTFLIINLALSDFLMGVALMCIGIKSLLMSGNYWAEEKEWRISNMCSGIGALIVLSSESSVFTLVVLTFYRLYGICRPFASRNLAPKRVFYAIAASWFISLLLALVPAFPQINESMLHHALINRSVYFSENTVSWVDFQTFATRAFVLNGSEYCPGEFTAWQYTIGRMSNEFPDYTPEVKGYFGYYSSHGVCMPRLFRTENMPPLHPLSLVVISVNFVSLLFIFVAYCLIYRMSVTTGRNARGANSEESNNRSMQRKISILVATDVLCWFPICIMTFLSQFGVDIPPVVYVIAAIILLPINSSMNPIIYSNGFQLTRKQIMKRCRNLLQKEPQKNVQNVNEEMASGQRADNIEMQEVNVEQ